MFKEDVQLVQEMIDASIAKAFEKKAPVKAEVKTEAPEVKVETKKIK